MDRRLQERLVGAVVLVAIIVIVVPELLSGPARRDAGESPVQAQDHESSSLRTYEIQFGAREDARQSAPAASGAAAPAATTLPAPEPAVSESGASAGSAPTTTAPEQVPAPATSPVAKPTANERPQATTAAREGTWAVQAGSFSRESGARQVAATLEKRGYPVFVAPFRNNGQTLYRVRVGPMAERADAEAVLRRLQADGVKGAVVSYP